MKYSANHAKKWGLHFVFESASILIDIKNNELLLAIDTIFCIKNTKSSCLQRIFNALQNNVELQKGIIVLKKINQLTIENLNFLEKNENINLLRAMNIVHADAWNSSDSAFFFKLKKYPQLVTAYLALVDNKIAISFHDWVKLSFDTNIPNAMNAVNSVANIKPFEQDDWIKLKDNNGVWLAVNAMQVKNQFTLADWNELKANYDLLQMYFKNDLKDIKDINHIFNSYRNISLILMLLQKYQGKAGYFGETVQFGGIEFTHLPKELARELNAILSNQSYMKYDAQYFKQNLSAKLKTYSCKFSFGRAQETQRLYSQNDKEYQNYNENITPKQ